MTPPFFFTAFPTLLSGTSVAPPMTTEPFSLGAPTLTSVGYLMAAVCFILALRGLSHPTSATRGVWLGLGGMILSIGVTLLSPNLGHIPLIMIVLAMGAILGSVIARTTTMTALPQLVAAFHSLVGLAAVGVATAAFMEPGAFNIATDGVIHTGSRLEMGLGLAIGAITFSGSVIAFGKLQGILSGKPVIFRGQHLLNALLGMAMVALLAAFTLTQDATVFFFLAALAFLLGFTLIVPIGGADMPVIVSMLNSYSGWAAAGIGFTLRNNLLIITGALVGASGAILSYIMCKGMNRSLTNVLLGGFGGETVSTGGADTSSTAEDKPIKAGSPDDAAFILSNAGSIIIVPGYGMAVAQAQHVLRDMALDLRQRGIDVKYAIHPVAGRMPGHMNVLLAEAGVDYDDVFELEDINRAFSQTDVAFVIGANDITNPAAKTDPASPIYGMPILDVEKAGTVMFVKRSMASGYAGVGNDVFFKANTMMLFGDAKKVCERIIKALHDL